MAAPPAFGALLESLPAIFATNHENTKVRKHENELNLVGDHAATAYALRLSFRAFVLSCYRDGICICIQCDEMASLASLNSFIC
jgi:hypothetical protein